MKHFVAIAGNIGVGKSSLTRLLEARLGWEPFYEAVQDNPYLSNFYEDMERWAFHSQIFFLSRRLQHHRQICSHPVSAIQDRSVYEDAEIFAQTLFLQGKMDRRDYTVYRDLYDSVSAFLPPPNLIVYLRANVDTLLGRIARRGREFEQGISRSYLEQLNELYDSWIEQFELCPVLTIAADEIDFVAQETDLSFITGQILEQLHRENVMHIA
ncbi:MAG: deoxynucleoside kinase [Ardenticatenales bacterium]|nr:deoxynucleoside kinase [Ardenticatenales bacterium]